MKILLEKILQEIKKTHNVRAFTDLKDICREVLKTDVSLAVEYLVKLSEECENIVPYIAERDLASAKQIMGVHKQSLILAAQNNHFDSFLQALEWNRSPDKIPDFSVYENISLPLNFSQKNLPKRKMVEMVEEVAAQLGITELIPKKISQLSGGEKQRVAIARALINSPKYIFADEPTGSLDSQNTQNIVEIFKSIAQNGVGVIIVTHDKSVATQCDVIWEMKDGRVL